MLGTQELILILIVALFLFGPSKLPELAQSLGKAMGEFKKAQMQAERSVYENERDIKIHNLAKQMGIDTENKSSDQLIEEIRLKVLSKKGDT